VGVDSASGTIASVVPVKSIWNLQLKRISVVSGVANLQHWGPFGPTL
jgi:hypothetical protein